MQGRLYRSESVLREAFEFLKQKDRSETPLRYLLYTPTAWLHYHRNEIDQATIYAAGASGYGEQVGFARDVVEGNVILSFCYMATGETEKAEQCLHKARLAAQEGGVSEASIHPDPWFVRFSMATGDVRKAVDWSSGARSSLDGAFSSRLIQDSVTYAELLIRQRSYRKAGSILTKLRRLCVNRNMMEAVLDIDIVRSTALFAQERTEQARRIIEKALSFAEAEGYVQPFVDRSSLILPLLIDLKTADLGLRQFSHVNRVLAACGARKGQTGAKRPEDAENRELTERELEILRLMTAGCRYKEIAQKTFVSAETVKTHVKHIFEKLNVDSRAKAVRRAHDLRLPVD